MSSPADRLGTKGQFKPGQSGNPGGKVSLKRDLERASAIWKGSDDHQDLVGLTPEDARARWWAMILPIAFAGPKGAKDSNWTYAAQEAGIRLLGKPKDHVIIEDGSAPTIDWRKVPEDRREALQAAIAELLLCVGEPDSPTEH